MVKSNEHTQPDPSQQGTRLPDLIQQLRSGILPSGEGQQILFINSTPSISGQMFLGPEGHPEYMFGRKFEGDFAGWETGDRMRSRYLVRKTIDEDGDPKIGLQVAESVVGDIRHADTFILENLSPEEVDALSGLGIAEVEAVVQVGERIQKDYQLSNMQDYTASLARVIAVQQPWDGDMTKVEKGKPLLVEGEVVSYTTEEWPHTDAEITVRIANQQDIRIQMWNGYIQIDSSSVGVPDLKNPRLGDIVQVNSFYGNPNARYHLVEPERLFTYWCRSTHLLKPGVERTKI